MTAHRSDCPVWCIADHAIEDEGRDRRHRSPTASLPGVRRGVDGAAQSVELLVEVHDDGTGTWVYLGDGVADGVDLTAGSAERLALTVLSTLEAAGLPQPSVAPKSSPSR